MNALVLKTSILYGIGGSNPSSSAKEKAAYELPFLFVQFLRLTVDILEESSDLLHLLLLDLF